jgi:hypothetical protein
MAKKKPTFPQVPDSIKAEVEAKAKELVQSYLQPTFIEPPPEDAKWNYIINIFTKWRGSNFYFCSTYACPGPNAISPTFETTFARMKYVGNGKFNLAYMRHTENWEEVFQGLSLDDCLQMIRDVGTFQP